MSEPIFKDPRFDALRNAIYHTERRNFFDLLNKFFNFLVVILGAGVAAKAATHANFGEQWLELGVVLFATAQLVFDFGGRARTHEFLQKRYYEMLSEMDTGDVESDEAKRKWSARLLTIAADEPLPMRALDALAFNKAFDAVTSDVAEARQNRLRVSWWQRRFRHLVAFQGVQFLPLSEYRNLLTRFTDWWKSSTH